MRQINIISPINKIPRSFDLFLSSIEKQEYPNKKLYLVVDNNNDLKDSILDHIDRIDFEVAVLNHEGISGPSAARNVALKAIDEGFITFLDCDDMLADNFLVKLNQYLDKKPFAKAVACSGQKFYVANDNEIKFGKKSNLIFTTAALTSPQIYLNEIGSISGFSISAENKVFFDESMFFLEDYDFYIKTLDKGINIHAAACCRYFYYVQEGGKRYDYEKQTYACRKILQNHSIQSKDNFYLRLLLALQAHKLMFRHSEKIGIAFVLMVLILLLYPMHMFRFIRRLINV